MSLRNSRLTNKHQKVNFEQYLYNANEPHLHLSTGLPPDLEAELLENSESMRQSFRRQARRMRGR